jgi:chromosome segregation ATPase
MATSSDPDTTLESDLTSEEHQRRVLARMELRIESAEAQVRNLQERVGELNQALRQARQRALYLRVGILIALLGAFFYMRSL